MIDIPGPQIATITVDYGEAHSLSIDFLKRSQAEHVDGGTLAVALVLSAGRVLSPEVLDDDEEIKFIQAAMDWMGMYFSGGGMN